MNWRWPSRKGNLLLPWYTILRRAILYPLLVVVSCVLYGVVYVSYGKRAAGMLWDEIRPW